MSLNQFILFVSAVCNIDVPSTVRTSLYKEECVVYYANCAVGKDGSINERKVHECLKEAKTQSNKWGK